MELKKYRIWQGSGRDYGQNPKNSADHLLHSYGCNPVKFNCNYGISRSFISIFVHG